MWWICTQLNLPALDFWQSNKLSATVPIGLTIISLNCACAKNTDPTSRIAEVENALKVVQIIKYLGHFITNLLDDNEDIMTYETV